MAYTPINWDEITPITPANLNKMYNQIDVNENDLRGHDNDIATLDSRVDGNDSDIANHESRISTNENDINNIENDFANNEIIKKAYPVGSIYINANNSTNPSSLLGFGSWSRFGEGRVLVSQDSTDADFDAIGETGGEKAHQLTEAEMPSHRHSITAQDTNTPAGSQLSGGTNGDNGKDYTDYTGGGNSHNNLQPYITVYMWVRTA